MMKKNYTALCLLLVLSNFYNWTSYGQTPVAVNDVFDVFTYSCNAIPLPVMNNDFLFGPSSSYTIDLDPIQPGIQSMVNTQTGSTFQVVGDSIQCLTLGWGFGNEAINYTIQDSLGNISNIGILTMNNFIPQVISDVVKPDCSLNNGQFTLSNIFFDTDATLNVFGNNGSILLGSYVVPAFSQQFTVANLAPDIYRLNLSLSCGQQIYMFYPISIFTNSPITTAIIPTYNDYNNDGIVNVGDTIDYQITATNTGTSENACTINDVRLQLSDNYPTNGLIPTMPGGVTDSSSLNYYRVLTQNDINNGSVYTYHTVLGTNSNMTFYGIPVNINLNISNGIKLNAFLDSNNNSIQDSGEPDYTQGTFSYQINAGAVHNINSSTGEHYLYETNPNNVYDLSYSINPANHYCGSQYLVATPSYSNVSVANGSGVTTYNFAITTVPCNDVAVYIYSDRNPRPGFIYTNYITYVNEGNQVAAGGDITFIKDSAISMLSNSVNAPMTATGFTHSFTNLNPGESETIMVYTQVPAIPTVDLGQLVTNSVSMTIADANASNNADALTRTIVGSYDPNDKTESHGGKILHSGFTANDYLTYTIRFENTGTAEAINIRVNDILNDKLDPTSIKMVRASHPYVLDRVGNNVTWRFDGVNLPPSIPGDEVTGHGYIVFQVKPTPGFTIGDIIPNTADIFFDFNPAIVTNTCTTEFVPFLGVNAFVSDTFEYYPNPTSDIVTFNLKNTSTTIETIEVMDLLGKTLLTKTNNYSNASIDLSSLSNGMYLVKVKAAGQEKTVKITKN